MRQLIRAKERLLLNLSLEVSRTRNDMCACFSRQVPTQFELSQVHRPQTTQQPMYRKKYPATQMLSYDIVHIQSTDLFHFQVVILLLKRRNKDPSLIIGKPSQSPTNQTIWRYTQHQAQQETSPRISAGVPNRLSLHPFSHYSLGSYCLLKCPARFFWCGIGLWLFVRRPRNPCMF